MIDFRAIIQELVPSGVQDIARNVRLKRKYLVICNPVAEVLM